MRTNAHFFLHGALYVWTSVACRHRYRERRPVKREFRVKEAAKKIYIGLFIVWYYRYFYDLIMQARSSNIY